jgi:hypothetical protein
MECGDKFRRDMYDTISCRSIPYITTGTEGDTKDKQLTEKDYA